MNREIKFRYHNLEEGPGETACPRYGITGILYGGGLRAVVVIDGDKWPVGEGLGILCQYTGLKDREGTEIYEGDIVEAKGWVPQRYEVRWIEGGFGLCNDAKMKGNPIDINMMFPSTGCLCKVVGNVHEHPELLTQ